MIEKSRLEELIKQGATIYEAKYGKVNPIDLAKQKVRFISEKMNMIDFEPSTEEKYLNHKYFHRLFETRKQAEWALKYQRIPRTEYLDLPTWEELITDDKYKYHYGLSFFDFDNYRLIACIPTEDDNTEFIGIDVDRNTELYHWDKATEENYEKACDLCVKLFKGEK